MTDPNPPRPRTRPAHRLINTLEQLAYALCYDEAHPASLDRYPFTRRLLEAIAAANSAELVRLQAAFPRESIAYQAWMHADQPPQTGALLFVVAAELKGYQEQQAKERGVIFDGGVLLHKDR